MDFTIEIDGPDSAKEASDLKDWIIKSRLKNLQSIEQTRKPPAAGEQGPTLLAILSVVLAGPAVIELTKSIQTWINTRKRKIKIKIKNLDKEITIEVSNPEDVESLIERALKAFQND